jgi:hypothetical protein
MKKCTGCGEEKSLSDYYANSRMKDGLLGKCKTCVCAVRKAYVQRNTEEVREKGKAYHLKNRDRLLEQQRVYKVKHRQRLAENRRAKERGFPPDLFNATLAAQGGACGICKVDLASLTRQSVHADHCHLTGTPRGILCVTCNTGLGKFKDDPAMLQRAIDYLRTPPVAIIT